ncbi:MAG: DUF6580 family putative transport protein [Candidatus Margulisiibacteriota bacterium]
MTQHVQRDHSIFLIVAMIGFGVMLRILPHPFNFTPIGAMGLYAGLKTRQKSLAFGLPLIAMFLSDLVLGFHSLQVLVYGCIALNVAAGLWLRAHFSWVKCGGLVLLCSTLFFMVTNFGVWVFSGMYPHTMSGLLSCFALAIPFFQNAVLGDFVYTGAFLGLDAIARRWIVSRWVSN